MNQQSDFRQPLAAFRTMDAPRLVAKTHHKCVSAFTEIRGPANHGPTAPIPYADAYLVQLRLLDCANADYFVDGRRIDGVVRRAGIIQVHDLQCNPTVDLRDPFHVLHFYLPRKLCEGVAVELGLGPVANLALRSGSCYEDSVLQHLLLSTLPAMARPEEANTLFIDHVAQAISTHVVQRYGGVAGAGMMPEGGLAPWQRRRAADMLEARLDGNVPLLELASECGLSVRHFSRAFRKSFGMPPHRYLLQRRVELARRLLLTPALAIHNVALACGFSDQSHFTRVFKLCTGYSPGQWRRANAD